MNMFDENDRENWLWSLPRAIREREEELPADLRDAYWDGFLLAKNRGWLEDVVPKGIQTKKQLQQIIAKQIGFIDGLKEIWPSSSK